MDLFKNMKIAVSSTGKNLESKVDEIFGRCPYFIIVEFKDNKIKGSVTVKNLVSRQTSGAGIATARMIVEKGANIIITGSIGPRALDVLRQFEVKVYFGKGLVKDVLQQFINSELREAK